MCVRVYILIYLGAYTEGLSFLRLPTCIQQQSHHVSMPTRGREPKRPLLDATLVLGV